MAKNIRGFLENLTDYFLNIIVNVNFFCDLKFEYYWALNKKLKLMGEAMKYFLKKLLGHEIFRSMVSWATNFFWKTSKTLRLLSYILNVRSLNAGVRQSFTVGPTLFQI